jgi:hypothetical protein
MRFAAWRKPLLYARDVIDLMGAYPGRDFKMLEILRYVGYSRILEIKKQRAMRLAVYRVLKQLEESGSILVRKRARTAVMYRWKTIT